MMGGFRRWRLRLVAVCIFLSIRSASSGKDFVNIACCADSTYTDPQTKFNYTSDFSWFSDRTSCRETSTVNSTGYNKTRIFDIVQGKRCYNLPTVKDQEYLLRGIFGSDKLRTSQDSPFDVSIGVSQLSAANSFKDLKIEGVFRSTKNYIDFCLLTKHEKPYISLIELRQLQNAEYLNGLDSSVLKLIRRVNLGSPGEDIRYPADLSDRIWQSNSSLEFSSYSSPTSNISDYSDGANVTIRPPPQVLATAATHPERLQFIYNELEAGSYEYRVFLYYMELNDTVRLGERVFDIYANNQIKVNSFDILANGSTYKQVYFNVTANGLLNLTMIKASGSQLGPICSAYEIFQVRPGTQENNQADSEAMLEVRTQLLEQNRENALLDSWSGDPCALYPWGGLECDNSSGSLVITALSLSSSNLKGPLPSGVTKLSNLKILNLSHNEFAGDIPSFPISSVLTTLDVSYNDFKGMLPDSFASLPNLKSLYYGCNSHLSKHISLNFSSSIVTDCGRCASKRSMQQTVIVIVTVACGSLLIVFAIGIIAACLCRRKLVAEKTFGGKGHLMESSMIFSFPSKDDFIISSVSIQPFTLDYIEAATEMYKTMIGEGGFGSVFRGILNDGQQVAVKVRSATSTQGTREFENELNLLSAIRHENLVPLLGYCCENEQQILVYPFMSNGSLQDRLYGEAAKRKVLDWPTRLSIALGAARGLTYLHTFAGRSIIHRDVKSSNILLDHSMCAKVADFGFSKYAPQEGDSGASLEVRGTAGYLDPEYYTTQHLSAKSDVFSFGVVLLEIVSGREPLNIHRPRNEWSLVEWAKPYLRESKIDEIVDPGIKGGYHAEAMWRVVEVALACIEPFSAYRPCMADIVRELEDALIIENNASEYMKSIDSLGGSNRYSIVLEKRIFSQPPPTTETSTSTSTIETQSASAPKPR